MLNKKRNQHIDVKFYLINIFITKITIRNWLNNIPIYILLLLGIELSVLMCSWHVIIKAVSVAKLFHAVLASVHKGVRKVNTLNVHQVMSLVSAGLLAYGALMQLGLSVVSRVLVKHIPLLTWKKHKKVNQNEMFEIISFVFIFKLSNLKV